LVLLVYFLYGRRHATLNTYRDPEEIAEPRGRRADFDDSDEINA